MIFSLAHGTNCSIRCKVSWKTVTVLTEGDVTYRSGQRPNYTDNSVNKHELRFGLCLIKDEMVDTKALRLL